MKKQQERLAALDQSNNPHNSAMGPPDYQVPSTYAKPPMQELHSAQYQDGWGNQYQDHAEVHELGHNTYQAPTHELPTTR